MKNFSLVTKFNHKKYYFNISLPISLPTIKTYYWSEFYSFKWLKLNQYRFLFKFDFVTL